MEFGTGRRKKIAKSMKRLPEFCLSFAKKKRGEEPMCQNCASTVLTVQFERRGRENSHVT
jgi:hypothetical protein